MASTQGILDTFQHNPKVGVIVTGSSFVGANIVRFIDGGHINPIIIELFQIGGYATTMLVGLFTIIGYIKRFRNKDGK